jgi:hypothetical protein
MKSFILSAVAALGLVLAAGNTAVAQNSYDGLNRWLTVNNYSGTGTAISIFIMPAGASCCWSRDLLGNDIIPPGRSFNVNFDDGSRACVFDVRITSEDTRRDWMFYNLDVCSNSAINLR